MDIIKQSVGIDIAKRSFTACVCKRKLDGSYELSKVVEFTNEKKGYNQLLKWVGKTMIKGIEIRLKQLMCGYDPLPEAIRIHKSSIKRLEKEIKKLELQMKEILQSDSKVWSKVGHLLTIKGIGLKTVAIVLGETQGFALIKNQRQLTSYCGYDVVQRESGTSIKGKTRISKKGNSQIRAAML